MNANFLGQIKSDADELGNLTRERVATRKAWDGIGTAIWGTAQIAAFTVGSQIRVTVNLSELHRADFLPSYLPSA